MEVTASVPQIIEELGYDPNFVNPTPIGNGIEHIVYLYAPPLEPKKALKVPKSSAFSFKLDLGTEELDRALIARYLPKYRVSARTLRRGGSYLIEAQFVAGRTLTLQDINTQRDKVNDLLDCNDRMVREVGASVDLFGFDGVKDLATLAILRRKPVKLANVLIAEDGSLKVIDDSLQHIGPFGSTYERVRGNILYRSSSFALWAAAGLNLTRGVGSKAL